MHTLMSTAIEYILTSFAECSIFSWANCTCCRAPSSSASRHSQAIASVSWRCCWLTKDSSAIDAFSSYWWLAALSAVNYKTQQRSSNKKQIRSMHLISSSSLSTRSSLPQPAKTNSNTTLKHEYGQAHSQSSSAQSSCSNRIANKADLILHSVHLTKMPEIFQPHLFHLSVPLHNLWQEVRGQVQIQIRIQFTGTDLNN